MVHHLSLLKVPNIPTTTSTPWTIQSQPCQCLGAYSPLLELNKNPQTRVHSLSDNTRRNWITMNSPSFTNDSRIPNQPLKELYNLQCEWIPHNRIPRKTLIHNKRSSYIVCNVQVPQYRSQEVYTNPMFTLNWLGSKAWI